METDRTETLESITRVTEAQGEANENEGKPAMLLGGGDGEHDRALDFEIDVAVSSTSDSGVLLARLMYLPAVDPVQLC